MTNYPRPPRGASLIAVMGITALLIAGCSRAGGDAGSGADEASPGITDTALSLGISSPLSGPVAGPGTCTVAGLYSYLEAKNADGGFEFGDGKTREVDLTYLDDAYDPAKAVSNFRQLVDDEGIFAYVGGLGTPTNAAIMPVANAEEVPQVLLFTGAGAFSEDQDANPWTFGALPTYENEGQAFGEQLVALGVTTVAVLRRPFARDSPWGWRDS